MEISGGLLWLVLCLDMIRMVLSFSLLFCVICIIVFFVKYVSAEEERRSVPLALYKLKKSILAGIIIGIMIIFIPNTNQAAMIITIPALVNNSANIEQLKDLNETSKLLIKLTNVKLQEMIEGTTPKEVK